MRKTPVSRSSLCRSLFATLSLSFLVQAAPAAAQPTPLSGLGSEALVVYDSNGIPHICTGSDRDTILMLGYVHAQDRFFQMDTLRRTFSGTLAARSRSRECT